MSDTKETMDSHDHHHDHHDLPFWRKYIFSLDHKVIGVQYGLTSLFFMLFGFALMMLMRWQLAFPGTPIPLVGNWLYGELGGIMPPEVYNQLGAMHGTIMIFLGVVPVLVGAFGNYVMPLQIGAPDMAFPKLNMMSYWVYLVGGILMLYSFFVPGGAPQSGWTSYPPLSVIAQTGQTIWLLSMVFLITSSLLGSINFIVTILLMRTKGLSLFRLPFFVWAQFVTAFLLLLAFPPLEGAAILQLMDRVAGTSFFMPSGLVVGGAPVDVAGGGSAILWQHLFWFLAHPEVYVLLLPAVGIVSEVIACNTRKPLYGYKSLVYATIFLGFMSFVVWAHHMFLTGMGTTMSNFFMVTTMIISVPSVVILTVLVITLWGGSIRFNTAMLFGVAFLPMFGIGGLTGLPLGLNVSDVYLHDTYYVIGHFHYVVAPGTIFAIFAGIYYWYPKVTGKRMNELLGKLHFWPSLIFMNGIFFSMLLYGLSGANRRLYDPTVYSLNRDIQGLNILMTYSALGLFIAQIPFIVNIFSSLLSKVKTGDNPWEATTLEWAAPSPPPHGNFAKDPVVYRGPYEYSVPGESKDFSPQHTQ